MIRIETRYSGPVPGVSQRTWAPILRSGYRVMGVYHHRSLLPKHFTHAGAREYRYTPRSGESGSGTRKAFRRSYTGRKLARFGHTRPMVYSGLMEQLSRARDLRVTSKGVRVVVHVPAYRGLRQMPDTRINLREELQTVSAKEGQELTRLFDRYLDSRLRSMSFSKRVRH